MKPHATFGFLLLLGAPGLAADLPPIPERPIAEKKELLFADIKVWNAEPAKR